MERLTARGRAAGAQGNVQLAAACYNRALAYRPDDQELIASVARLVRRERLRKGARRGIVIAGAVFGGGVLVAGASRFVPRAEVEASPGPRSSAIATARPVASTGNPSVTTSASAAPSSRAAPPAVRHSPPRASSEPDLGRIRESIRSPRIRSLRTSRWTEWVACGSWSTGLRARSFASTEPRWAGSGRSRSSPPAATASSSFPRTIAAVRVARPSASTYRFRVARATSTPSAVASSFARLCSICAGRPVARPAADPSDRSRCQVSSKSQCPRPLWASAVSSCRPRAAPSNRKSLT